MRLLFLFRMNLGWKYELKIAAIDFDHTVPIVASGGEVDIRIVEETGDGHYLVDTPTIIDPLAEAQV